MDAKLPPARQVSEKLSAVEIVRSSTHQLLSVFD